MDDMLIVNVDTVGEAAIVECEGMILTNDDALQLCDAVTRHAALRVMVIDLSKVSVIAGIGLTMLASLQRWAREFVIRLKLFNPHPSVRRDLDRAGLLYDLEFASLGEVMALVIDAADHQPPTARLQSGIAV
jgi:anti-anti-sigma regulatory factor